MAYKSQKIICSICARGGSKGVPGKNIKLIAGRPLIAHSIKHAIDTGIFDLIVVSSDSDEILKISKESGVNLAIKRPESLATDTSAKIPVIKHCIKMAEEASGLTFDIVVDIDATSPLRLAEDITGCVDMLINSNVKNVITGSISRRSPYFNLVEEVDGVVKLSKQLAAGVVRRQDAPISYDMNASIYVWKKDALFNNEVLFLDDTKIYVMPEDRSVDIDSLLDYKIVELMLNERRTNE
jgi:N-acylneuraminate cytidylyltransferase/CMP-N,N'-diacetyllegionaminic acid synthase